MSAYKVVLLIISTVAFSVTGLGQCAADPRAGELGKDLRSIVIDTKESRETGLSIKASVPSASWDKAGSEAAVLSVFVNGEYVQDVILFAGSKPFDYKILLGRLEKGRKEISLKLNVKRSAKNIRSAKILSVTAIYPKASDKVEQIAIANAPYIYVRPNVVDRFSDIALITYYEIVPQADSSTKIIYTTIFTNEDGGTQSQALMARWGRMTDIEWVYEMHYKDGKILSETIQGENHQIKKFDGKRVFGTHPLIYDTTVNNNFSDTGCSSLRTANFPLRVDLTNRSRETVMDADPWTYRIMAEEAAREGRVDGKSMGTNTIDDLRNYLFVEVFSENTAAAVSVEAVSTAGEVFRSDLNDSRLRVGRPGHQRIAFHFPLSTKKLASLSLVCSAVPSISNARISCGASRILYFQRLNDAFSPVKTTNPNTVSNVFESRERAVWRISN